ncbi:hypothetical protein F5Y19DRAFT_413443, partial [Xylariaceae sp. FL1651]
MMLMTACCHLLFVISMCVSPSLFAVTAWPYFISTKVVGWVVRGRQKRGIIGFSLLFLRGDIWGAPLGKWRVRLLLSTHLPSPRVIISVAVMEGNTKINYRKRSAMPGTLALSFAHVKRRFGHRRRDRC